MPAPANKDGASRAAAVSKFKTGDNTLRLLLASSNLSKLREYRMLAARHHAGVSISLDLLPDFSDIPPFEESAPTFGENAVGKALYYSRFAKLPVFADDSGLVVEALHGAPGVHSARYAGPGASDAQRIAKLLSELKDSREHTAVALDTLSRRAHFVCVIALAVQGQITAALSDSVEGEIVDSPRGALGFGYDPVFLFPPLGKTFAELPGEEKNNHSHRGKAFRKLLDSLDRPAVL